MPAGGSNEVGGAYLSVCRGLRATQTAGVSPCPPLAKQVWIPELGTCKHPRKHWCVRSFASAKEGCRLPVWCGKLSGRGTKNNCRGVCLCKDQLSVYVPNSRKINTPESISGPAFNYRPQIPELWAGDKEDAIGASKCMSPRGTRKPEGRGAAGPGEPQDPVHLHS